MKGWARTTDESETTRADQRRAERQLAARTPHGRRPAAAPFRRPTLRATPATPGDAGWSRPTKCGPVKPAEAAPDWVATAAKKSAKCSDSSPADPDGRQRCPKSGPCAANPNKNSRTRGEQLGSSAAKTSRGRCRPAGKRVNPELRNPRASAPSRRSRRRSASSCGPEVKGAGFVGRDVKVPGSTPVVYGNDSHPRLQPPVPPVGLDAAHDRSRTGNLRDASNKVRALNLWATTAGRLWANVDFHIRRRARPSGRCDARPFLLTTR